MEGEQMSYIREWAEGRMTLDQICDKQSETASVEEWDALEAARIHAIDYNEYMDALSGAVHG